MSAHSISYDTFLRNKHEKFHTEQKHITDAVEQALHTSISSQERVIQGEVNEVYKITTNEGQIVFIRIMHKRPYPLLREKWAIDECSGRGIPVPKIIYTHQFFQKDIPRTLTIQEQAQGVPLKDLEHTVSDTLRQRYTEHSGEILARIHQIRTTGYGKIKESGRGTYTSYETYLREPIDAYDELCKAGNKAHIDRKHITTISTEYEKLIHTYTTCAPHLLHYDYGPEHIYFLDGFVSGIIDFGECASGDPVLDLVRWDYFQKPHLPVNSLITGYEKVSPIKNEYETKKRFYMLHLALNHLLYFYWDDNHNGLKHTKKQVEALVANTHS